jgi:hypothetical protein
VRCLKRLYLEVHQPELAVQPDASAEAITGAPEGAREASVSFDRTRCASHSREHLTYQTDHLSNKLDENANNIVAALIRPPQ